MSLPIDSICKSLQKAPEPLEAGNLKNRSVSLLTANQADRYRLLSLSSIIPTALATLVTFSETASWPTAIAVGSSIFSAATWAIHHFFTPLPAPIQPLPAVLKYIEVKYNDVIISENDDEVLFTKNLSACVAIVIGNQFDQSTHTFRERRLAHLLGGSLAINPTLTKKLFENLNQDASIVIAFGTLYTPNSADEKSVVQEIQQYCKENHIPINLRQMKREYTHYNSSFTGTEHEPGSFQVFPNNLLIPRELKIPIKELETFFQIHPVPSILDLSVSLYSVNNASVGRSGHCAPC